MRNMNAIGFAHRFVFPTGAWKGKAAIVGFGFIQDKKEYDRNLSDPARPLKKAIQYKNAHAQSDHREAG
jgi:hypothetical protein